MTLHAVQDKPHDDSLSAQADRVLQFLNEKTGRNFRFTATNRGYVIARIREGYTEAECIQVIAMKVREWRGATFRDGRSGDDYLNPETLFRASNFNRYAGYLG